MIKWRAQSLIFIKIHCKFGGGLRFPVITYGKEHFFKAIDVIREEYHIIVSKGVILSIVIPDINSLGKNKVACRWAIHFGDKGIGRIVLLIYRCHYCPTVSIYPPHIFPT